MENYLKSLIKEQEDYIRELIDEDSVYTLNQYLDVTKSDKMSAYVSNPEIYNFELGKYIAYKDIFEKLNKN